MGRRPSYLDIVDDIRRQIASGQLAPGTALPTCRQLCDNYQVSRQTIGSAMIVLRTQGLVVGQQGREAASGRQR
jgi:DNA-binding GntR family transcriptional regulator